MTIGNHLLALEHVCSFLEKVDTVATHRTRVSTIHSLLKWHEYHTPALTFQFYPTKYMIGYHILQKLSSQTGIKNSSPAFPEVQGWVRGLLCGGTT